MLKFDTVRARAAALVAVVSTAAVPAFAEIPAEVTTAIGEMKSNGLIIAGAVLVAIIAVAAVKFLRKGL